MNHADFKLGLVFYSDARAPQPYIVTDIGQRVIVASLYVLPSDRDELGDWLEFVFQPREFSYCTTVEPPHAVHCNRREDESRQRRERDGEEGSAATLPQGELFA